MANIEAALASAWLPQIGIKTVAVMGVPDCVASGLPFSVKLAGAELALKRPVLLDSIPPPPPDDFGKALTPSTEMCHEHQEYPVQNTLRTVDFEARRVFFCDKFEGALKWSYPLPSTLTRCEEPPPSALRFELRPLPPVENDSSHHLHCLCVSGGIPNAKVDRNWVIAQLVISVFIIFYYVILGSRSMGCLPISEECNLSECSLMFAVQVTMQTVPFCSFAMIEIGLLLHFA
jgi:hypothetical protein